MAFQFIALLCLGLICWGVAGRTISSQTSTGSLLPDVLKDDAMKIIQPTNDADYDCVDIYKQPAFDHPLLKNHKIQLEPTFQLESKKSSSKGGGCPQGKVPIKRMNASLLQSYPDQFHQFTSGHPGQHFATIYTDTWSRYHGAGALIDVYNPPAKRDQVSMAQIWLQNGPPNELNNIQAGWAVHPRIYGDGRTYMTTYWTADAYQRTGCYNSVCPGFVQVHRILYPGQPVSGVSVYGGQQYILDLKIIQDKTRGHWWLISGRTERVGYWPNEILAHLAEGANKLRFGGWTFSSPDGIGPPMGSGHFADRFTKRSCFFARIKQVDWEYRERDISYSSMRRYADNEGCYTIDYWGDQGPHMGETLTFGGPGGNCGI